MTKEELKSFGYNVSAHIEQTQVDKAESEIMQAYIEPLIDGRMSYESCQVRKAVADLIFLRLMQSTSDFVTRSGAKTKTATQSNGAGSWDMIREQSTVCYMSLDVLQTQCGNLHPHIIDICHVYFKSNYFYV